MDWGKEEKKKKRQFYLCSLICVSEHLVNPSFKMTVEDSSFPVPSVFLVVFGYVLRGSGLFSLADMNFGYSHSLFRSIL